MPAKFTISKDELSAIDVGTGPGVGAAPEMRATAGPSGLPVSARPEARAATEAGIVARSDPNPTAGDDKIMLAAEIAASMFGANIGGRVARPIARRLAGSRGVRAAGRAALAGRATGAAVGSGGVGFIGSGGDPMAGLEAAGRGALGELGGAAAERFVLKPLGRRAVSLGRKIPGLRRVIAPFENSLNPGARETLDILDELDPLGETTPTLGQLVDVPFTDELENIAEAGLLSRPGVFGQRRRAGKLLTSALDDLVEGLGGANPQAERVAGEMLQGALRGNAKAQTMLQRATFRALKREVGRRTASATGAAGGVRVEPTIQLKRVGQLASALEKRLVDPSLKSQAGRAKAIIDDVAGKGGAIPLGDAITLRSDLLAIGRQLDEPLSGKTERIVDTLAKGMDQQITKALRALPDGGDLVQMWREANDIVRAGKQTFNGEVVRKLLRHTTPEKVFRLGVRDQPGSQIEFMRKQVQQAIARGDVPEGAWQAVQGEWLMDAMRNSTSEGVLDGTQFANKILRTSPDELSQLFPETATRLKQLARGLQITQASAGQGQFGAVAVRLAQSGQAIKIAEGGALLSAPGITAAAGPGVGIAAPAFIFLTPMALGKVVADPAAVRWLSVGMQQGPTRLTSRAMGQLAIRLDKILDPGEGGIFTSGGGDVVVGDEARPGRGAELVLDREQLLDINFRSER